jgi:PPOX class probable F420-dependent enzyme
MTATEYPSAHLRDHSYISLTTFRKNGEGVPTPVTFGEANGSGKLYVVTGLKTGKIKRLQNNPTVEVAPCDQKGTALGTSVLGQARILSAEEGKVLRKQIKFRAPAPIMFVFNLLRDLQSGGNVYLEISLK